jgi:hypothetical protein
MALSGAERARRFRDKIRDPDALREVLLTELFEMAIGRRPSSPSKIRAAELWLQIHGGLPPAVAVGKKATAEIRARTPIPPDNPWGELLNHHQNHRHKKNLRVSPAAVQAPHEQRLLHTPPLSSSE